MRATDFVLVIKTRTIYLFDNVGGRCVTYVDECELYGQLPKEKLGFHKRSSYQQQREYRIKIDFNFAEPKHCTLDVGDLSDIAMITTPEEFNKQLEV